MPNIELTHEWFKTLPIHERIEWVDKIDWSSIRSLHSTKTIKHFFVDLYHNEDNLFLKNTAINYIGDLTLLNVIRRDFTKDFLIEEVQELDDVFIACSRIRCMFLLFGDDPEIHRILDKEINNVHAEISSEAYYRKGLIHLLYKLEQKNDVDIITELNTAQHFFQSSQSLLENRIDATFFGLVTNYLLNLLSQNITSSNEKFDAIMQTLWERNIRSTLPDYELLEYSIYNSLKQIKSIVESVTQESNWLDYKKELCLLSKYTSDMVVGTSLSERFTDVSEAFTRGVTSSVLDDYYISNLSASRLKIDALLSELEPTETDTILFLQDLKLRITQDQKKSDQRLHLSARLVALFPSISLLEISQDIEELNTNGKTYLAIETELALRYISRLNPNRTNYATGYQTSDEVLKELIVRIKQLLPNYSPNKLNIFIDVLSDMVRYTYQSIVQPKEFFAHLYDSSITNEKVFQRHLYERLTGGERALFYRYEPTDVIGGGRVDIVYDESGIIFPIEIKKSDIVPTWETIRNDYVAQIDTYTHPYNQLGVLIVFDLSSKQNNNPINDFRSLFEILQLRPLYSIIDKYPDYIITAIVPGNKISPSRYTTYH